MLTEPQLRAFLPALASPALWTAALGVACSRFEIMTRTRLAAFLAQMAHESRGFTHIVENLNYSAPRLMHVWPRKFPTIEHARPYASQPEKLANYVYANRNGNGGVESGDGWRFRGRGLIQLTGRGNYRLAAIALQIPVDETPAMVEQPDLAALTAAQFWDSKGLNAFADLDSEEAFVRITRRINGGLNGLDDRRRLWARAKAALI